MKQIKKTINTPGGIFSVCVLCITFLGIAVIPSHSRGLPTPTEFHFNARLEFDGENFAREQYPLPLAGEVVTQCTPSDEWALEANVTCQWLDDLDIVSVTVLNPVTSTLPVTIGVSVFAVNYTPLVSEGK